MISHIFTVDGKKFKSKIKLALHLEVYPSVITRLIGDKQSGTITVRNKVVSFEKYVKAVKPGAENEKDGKYHEREVKIDYVPYNDLILKKINGVLHHTFSRDYFNENKASII